MMYEGPTYTIWDRQDLEKSVVVGISLDADDELYLAFHLGGSPVLKNAKYTRDGKWNKGGDQPADKRTYMYIPKASLYGLYDLLGELLGGEISQSVVDMESPAYNEGMTVDDMLGKLDDGA